MRFYTAFTITFLFIITLCPLSAEKYKLPPQEVIDIVDAPPPPQGILSPNGNLLLLATYESMPSIAYMAQPLLRIAGRRILPGNNSAQQTFFYTGLQIKNLINGQTRDIELPPAAKMIALRWSPDSQWLTFLLYTNDRVELWGVSVGSSKAKRLSAQAINTTLSEGYRWLPKSRRILLSAVVKDRGQPPVKPLVPEGPVIQESGGKAAKVRTYQDLLQSPYDEALFEYYCTSQLVELDVNSGKEQKVGKPGIFTLPTASPDGQYLLVRRIKKPFSYLVPWYRFAHSIEVWSRDGQRVYQVADQPLAEAIPLHGVITGPRSVSWRALKPAELVWVEALDGGDPHKEVPYRDKLLTLSAPFGDKPYEVTQIENRFRGIDWLDNGQGALIFDYDWKKRWIKLYWMENFDSPGPMKTLFSLSRNDRYGHPGNPVYKETTAGEYLVRTDGDWIYMSGQGASPKGDLPFLNKFNLRSKETRTLYRCAEGSYETFNGFTVGSTNNILTRYETKTEPPNYYLVDLKSGKRKKITAYKDPAPQLTGLQKTLLKYKRADGVDLSGTLYLPPDYKKGQRLPLMIWAYPREYRDPKIAGQIKGSPNRFTFLRGTSPLFFVTQGYAVLDGAQMPVVGDPQTMNDTFIEQIVASAQAAIDYLDSLGLIDPKRVGVAGHSYGAFMTANLLAHSNIFAAGIARSGAYNRTLTPFGFQAERRTLWEAPEIYFKISPFMHADKVKTPILLIHGEADNNSGTFPIQSKRFFHALKGFGVTARLVLLPYESHGYRARESVLHVLAEMFEWFDKYVKNRTVEPK